MARGPTKRFRELCRDAFYAYGKRVIGWDDLSAESQVMLIRAWPNENAPNAFERIVGDVAVEFNMERSKVDPFHVTILWD